MLKHYKDLSPYLRRCNTLQLSPDFLMPQDMNMAAMGDEDMITNSTIVDGDEPMSSSCNSAGSSGSDNNNAAMMGRCTSSKIARKKRSAWNVCARLMGANNNKISDEDMASSFSRRKGIPHRSPLC